MKKLAFALATSVALAVLLQPAAAQYVPGKPPKQHGTEGIGILPLENDTVVTGTVKTDDVNVTGVVGINNKTDEVSGGVLVTINPLEPTKEIQTKPLPSEEPLAVFQDNMTQGEAEPLDFGQELEAPDMVVETPQESPLGIPSLVDQPAAEETESVLGIPSLVEPEADTATGTTGDPIDPVMEAPETAEAPATQEPVSGETAGTATDAPDDASDQSAIVDPVTGDPAVAEPAVGDGFTDKMPMTDPAGEDPSFEAPDLIDEPVIEDPYFDEPIFEEPIYNEPIFDEPIYDEPVLFEEPLVFDQPDFGDFGGGGGGGFDDYSVDYLQY